MIIDMESVFVLAVLTILGLMFGSFSGATVWRLRGRQLVADKEVGELVDQEELESLSSISKATILSDRSQCLNCQEVLKWYDLVPVVSWLSLGGKCRYCKSRIGFFEPLIEVGLVSAFVASYLLWPEPLDSIVNITLLVLWLASLVVLAILFAYDFKWFLLPDIGVFVLIALGTAMTLIRIFASDDMVGTIISAGFSLMILSGLYYMIWLFSKGAWVGFGDVKLGIGLALMLTDWRLALLALFSANLFGTIIVLPGLLLGKVKRGTHVPFGPMLIMGTIFSALLGTKVIEAYLNLLF